MNVGGQAVMEGVMMRNKERFAVAVRKKDGSIALLKEKSSFYPKFFEAPIMRGAVGLFYTLYDGMKALVWSSNQSLETEEKLTSKEIVFTIITSLLMAVLFFIVIPFFSARAIHADGLVFNLLDGLFRGVLFVGYLVLISRMNDVKRLFQYHGAEHKTIYCYEAKKELTVENVKPFIRFHPRCGTSFIFIVLILSIILFTAISGPWWIKLVGRIVLLPVIAGIAYELIKLSEKFQKNIIVKILIAPGLWLQRITTKEPSEKQLEVAIAALKGVLE